MMSVKERVENSAKISAAWKVEEKIGSGSGGKTSVFRIVRRSVSSLFTEEYALKVINIITVDGNKKDCSESFIEDYEKHKAKLIKNVENELALMYILRDFRYIVNYDDYVFEDWEDDNSFGCDLMIRMNYYNVLKKSIRDKEYDDNEIIKVGCDICSALEACHAKNIIHRDIKPENIFINQNGEYMLGDFGISKLVDEFDIAETKIGTMEYMAPELINATDGEGYDELVDVYSLGLVLYQLANDGKMAFCGSQYIDKSEVELRLSGKPFPRPCACSEALGDVILKACAYDKEKRYQSAHEMHEALVNLRVGQDDNIQVSSDVTDDRYQTLIIDPDSKKHGNKTRRRLYIIMSACIAAVVLAIAAIITSDNRKVSYVSESIDKGSSQSIDESTDKSSSQSVDESTDKGSSQSVDKSTSQSTYKDDSVTLSQEYTSNVIMVDNSVVPKSIYLRKGVATVISNWKNQYNNEYYDTAYMLNRNNKGYIDANEDCSAVGYLLDNYLKCSGNLLVVSHGTDGGTTGYKALFIFYAKKNDTWNKVIEKSIAVDGEPVEYNVPLSEGIGEIAIHVIAPSIPIEAYFY